MTAYLLTIALAICASASYHIIARSAPENANPALLMASTYGVGLIVSLLLLVAFPLQKNWRESLSQLSYSPLLLGCAVVGIEMGFILAYRAGWDVHVAPLVSNLSVALLLTPIGLIFFKEHMKPVNMIGVVVCIIGLILINRK